MSWWFKVKLNQVLKLSIQNAERHPTPFLLHPGNHFVILISGSQPILRALRQLGVELWPETFPRGLDLLFISQSTRRPQYVLVFLLGQKNASQHFLFFQYAMSTEILSFPLLQGNYLQRCWNTFISLDMTNSTIMKEDLYRVFCSSPADYYSNSSKHTHHMDHWHTLRNATLS